MKKEPLTVFSCPAALTDEIDRLRAEVEALRAELARVTLLWREQQTMVRKACEYCKPDETPAERIARELADSAALMKLYEGAVRELADARKKLADGDAGAQRRLLGRMVALPEFMVDGSIPKALEILHGRIEALPASLEATAASSLCHDLLQAVNGDRYAQDHVCSVIATVGQEASQ